MLMPKGEMLTKDITDEINKYPKILKHTCKSKMLQCILDMKNLGCGTKDSYYNDIISFERYWHEWDHDVILLTEWNWNRKNKDSYVYVEPKGIYTDISIFARSLQYLLPSMDKIHVDLRGEELSFTIYEDEKFNSNKTYETKFLDLNQRDPKKHIDGWKFEIENLKNLEK